MTRSRVFISERVGDPGKDDTLAMGERQPFAVLTVGAARLVAGRPRQARAGLGTLLQIAEAGDVVVSPMIVSSTASARSSPLTGTTSPNVRLEIAPALR